MGSETFAEGWAVADDTGLQINTVSANRRSAIVNWLIIKARVPVPNNYSDEEIEYLWERYGLNSGRAEVHQVRCYVAQEEEGDE